MADIAKLAIEVSSNGIKIANSELDKLTSKSGKTEKAVDKVSDSTKRLNSNFSKATTATNNFGKSVATTYSSMIGFKEIIAVVAFSRFVTFLKDSADTMTRLDNQLKTVTSSTRELSTVQEKLYVVSQQTYVKFEDSVNLYARMARAVRQIGYEEEEILKVTKAVNQSFTVSGSSIQEASSAVLQLGQGLSSGRLQGEELRAVLENAPVLARAIADGMNRAYGELRTLGKEGQLTTTVVFDALLDQADEMNAKFIELNPTMGQAFTTVYNSIRTSIGGADELLGISERIAKVLLDISGAIDSAGSVLSGAFEAVETSRKAREEGIPEDIVKKQQEIQEVLDSMNPLRVFTLEYWGELSTAVGTVGKSFTTWAFGKEKAQEIDQELVSLSKSIVKLNNSVGSGIFASIFGEDALVFINDILGVTQITEQLRNELELSAHATWKNIDEGATTLEKNAQDFQKVLGDISISVSEFLEERAEELDPYLKKLNAIETAYDPLITKVENFNKKTGEGAEELEKLISMRNKEILLIEEARKAEEQKRIEQEKKKEEKIRKEQARLQDIENKALIETELATAQQQIAIINSKYDQMVASAEAYSVSTIGIEAERSLKIQEIWRKEELAHGTMLEGFISGLNSYADESVTAFSRAETAGLALASSLESGLSSMLSFTGEGFANWGESVSNILNDILDQLIQILVISPLIDSFTGAVGSLFGGGASVATGSVNTSYLSGFSVGGATPSVTNYAKGGVLLGGDISNYSSSIVTRPTTFNAVKSKKYAKGGSLMGEAGAEGILPLGRTSKNELGVKIAGGTGAGGDIKIVINNYGEPSTAEAEQKPDGKGGYTLDIIMKPIKDMVAQGIATSGTNLNRATKFATGVAGM